MLWLHDAVSFLFLLVVLVGVVLSMVVLSVEMEEVLVVVVVVVLVVVCCLLSSSFLSWSCTSLASSGAFIVVSPLLVSLLFCSDSVHLLFLTFLAFLVLLLMEVVVVYCEVLLVMVDLLLVLEVFGVLDEPLLCCWVLLVIGGWFVMGGGCLVRGSTCSVALYSFRFPLDFVL